MLLMTAVMIVGAAVTPPPPEQRAVQFIVPIVYALIAGWGIVTGVGVLQLRHWAWVSIIVMSGVTIFFSVFGAVGLLFVPSLLRDQPDLPVASVKIVAYIGLVILLIPFAIAIWWLVLFTRDRVRLQFTKHSATSEIANPDDLPRPLMNAPSPPQIPTSIRVIAIISIAGAALVLLSLQLVVGRHLPMLIFGMFASGWLVLAYGAALVTAQSVLPIYTLRKRAWALEGMIWYAVINLANAFLFLASPERNRYFAVAAQRDVVPPGVSAEALNHLGKTTTYASFGFAICVGVICLYFLLTRRKAYRLACEARRTAG